MRGIGHAVMCAQSRGPGRECFKVTSTGSLDLRSDDERSLRHPAWNALAPKTKQRHPVNRNAAAQKKLWLYL